MAKQTVEHWDSVIAVRGSVEPEACRSDQNEWQRCMLHYYSRRPSLTKPMNQRSGSGRRRWLQWFKRSRSLHGRKERRMVLHPHRRGDSLGARYGFDLERNIDSNRRKGQSPHYVSVCSVDADGPAAQAGIHSGDHVLQVSGQLVEGVDCLTVASRLLMGVTSRVDVVILPVPTMHRRRSKSHTPGLSDDDSFFVPPLRVPAFRPPGSDKASGTLSDGSLWLCENMSRQEACYALDGKSDGSFLIRSRNEAADGEVQATVYILSVVFGEVQHMRILETNGMFHFAVTDNRHPTLASLVEYFKANSLGDIFDEVPICLTQGYGRPLDSRDALLSDAAQYGSASGYGSMATVTTGAVDGIAGSGSDVGAPGGGYPKPRRGPRHDFAQHVVTVQPAPGVHVTSL
eukprot:m.397175 g.397175  ORF g.397175 m.397175 type:complete len:401 (-) comp20104_c10_seq16:224-1426(-)